MFAFKLLYKIISIFFPNKKGNIVDNNNNNILNATNSSFDNIKDL